jgi:hypothetical protein
MPTREYISDITIVTMGSENWPSIPFDEENKKRKPVSINPTDRNTNSENANE